MQGVKLARALVLSGFASLNLSSFLLEEGLQCTCPHAPADPLASKPQNLNLEPLDLSLVHDLEKDFKFRELPMCGGSLFGGPDVKRPGAGWSIASWGSCECEPQYRTALVLKGPQKGPEFREPHMGDWGLAIVLPTVLSLSRPWVPRRLILDQSCSCLAYVVPTAMLLNL